MASVLRIESLDDAGISLGILGRKRHRVVSSLARNVQFATQARDALKAGHVAEPPKIFPVDFYPNRHIVLNV